MDDDNQDDNNPERPATAEIIASFGLSPERARDLFELRNRIKTPYKGSPVRDDDEEPVASDGEPVASGGQPEVSGGQPEVSGKPANIIPSPGLSSERARDLFELRNRIKAPYKGSPVRDDDEEPVASDGEPVDSGKPAADSGKLTEIIVFPRPHTKKSPHPTG